MGWNQNQISENKKQQFLESIEQKRQAILISNIEKTGKMPNPMESRLQLELSFLICGYASSVDASTHLIKKSFSAPCW